MKTRLSVLCVLLVSHTYVALSADMQVESVSGNSNSFTIVTTGAEYVLTRTDMQMWRRIDPNTNTVNPREVATLSFNSDIGPLSIESNDVNTVIIQSSLATFKFNLDSLFFVTAKSSFSYTHTNLITNAPWNKGLSLDRMWTDGYGGSLHANVNNGAAVSSSGTDFTVISMTSSDVIAHMVYPPRFYDFESLYGENSRPHVHFLGGYNLDELMEPNEIDPYIENGYGVILPWATIYENPVDLVSRPFLLDSGIMGYKVREPNEVKAFVDFAHQKGFKVISYIVYLQNPAWKYPAGHPNAGQYQDVSVTLQWMRDLQDEYDFDGWYLDSSETGDFMADYDFVRQVREDIGEDGIIYHHDSIDAWGYNLGFEYRYCGLRAVFQNAYVDYRLAGELGDIATVDTPNDSYYRFYTGDYGMGQSYCAHKRKSALDIGVSEEENDRVIAENLNGTQRTRLYDWRPSWLSHFKPAYDVRKAEYLSGTFDPDVDWPIDTQVGWFRDPLNIEVSVAGTRVTVTWETQEPADSEVAYTSDGIWWSPDGPDGTVIDSSTVTKHSIVLENLIPFTDYEFKIRSSNRQAVPDEIIWGHIGNFSTSYEYVPYYWRTPLDSLEPNTVMLIHFDQYATGFTDRVNVESTSDSTETIFWMADTDHVYLDNLDSVPHPGFSKYLLLDGTESNGYGRTYAPPQSDIRRGPMTIEGWVKMDNYPSGDTPRYLLFRYPQSGDAFSVDIEQDGKIRFSHTQQDGYTYLSSNSTLSLDEWHHIAVTRTYSPTANPSLFDYEVKIFIDGLLDKKETWTGQDYLDPMSGLDRFYVGGGASGVTGYPFFEGCVDEVRISDHIKITEYCEDGFYLAGDISRDCQVNMEDVAGIALNWSQSNSNPNNYQQAYDRTEPCTIALIHFDEYTTGDWINVESTDSESIAYFDPYTTASYITDTAPTVPYPGFGKYYNIDPTGDRWDGHNRTSVDIPGETMRGPLTVEAWINVDTLPSTRYILFQQSGSGEPWSVTFEDDGHIRFGHEQTDGFRYVHGNMLIPLNEWHHLRCTRTWEDVGSGLANYEVNIYIDGVLDKTETWMGANYVDNSTVQNFRIYVGGNGGSVIPVLDGSVDELRVSNTLRSAVGGYCEDGIYLEGDINTDCNVNIEDLALFVSDWLKCNKESDLECWNY